MQICLISGSSRGESQTLRVVKALGEMLETKSVDVSYIDLFEENLTAVLPDIWSDKDGQGALASKHQETIAAADGFVIATPEWAGMASPALKALMLSAGDGFAHKPAMIVAVSASRGGSYPVAELRMSSYKNTKIVYIPDHLIVRDVESAFTGDGASNDSYIAKRADFSLNALVEYAKAMAPLAKSESLKSDEYAFGM